jgi:alpha,alpha-trehalase
MRPLDNFASLHRLSPLPEITLAMVILVSGALPPAQAQAMKASTHNSELRAIREYISSGWDVLTRSTSTCQAVADSKLTEEPILYVPADMAIPDALQKLPQECKLQVEHIPFVIRAPGQVAADREIIHPPGLLYLEYPYVVPGGRFNEMYGWDSYFIIRGLLRDGRIDLARGMVDDFFFEIEHYGAVLNANRTYYLTRSQPPFLSSMVRAVYEAEKLHGPEERAWLKRAYQYVNRDYEMWMHAPHLAGPTGLSRYYDFGEGPVPEGLHDETRYYHDVLAYFLKEKQSPFVIESDRAEGLLNRQYSLQLCETDPNAGSPENCERVKYVALSPEYYKGDRSMRESGFDISFRFGPYGAETHHYAPVCLNSLLYKTEKDMETISGWLHDNPSASLWQERAAKREKIIRTLLWNPQRGMFFDYDFVKKEQSSYQYATTFYPLWAGLATREEARAIAKNVSVFEQSGGLAMSTKETGVQWDYPYGWAPIQLLAVEGLRRYGYDADADRISFKFLSMVLANFQRDGNLREKYNVVTDSSNVQVAEGYRSNIVGFGWTNGVFLVLLNELPPELRGRLGKEAEQSPR